MTKPNIPVYFEEFQSLVLCRLDSLVIDITNYEYNRSITNRLCSSSQRRLLGQTKQLHRQCCITSRRRWLQGSRAYLYKLGSTTCLHRWTVRQPRPRNLHQQKEETRHQVPHPTCLTSTARYTKRGLYIPLFVAAVVLFPLATTLSTNHIMKQNKPLVASDRELDAAKIVFACIVGVQLITFIAIIAELQK